MLFAWRLFTLSICLTCICGNDVISNNAASDSTHISTTPRTLTSRNQTKVTRDDQLLTLLAARRRQIIQNRFKTHLKTIVDLSTSRPNTTKKNDTSSNATTIHLHLNLSELLHNSVHNSSEENVVQNAPSTESNLVDSTTKAVGKRKNVSANTPQSKENKTRANMPIIRNILYRRKMSFLNRKLPIDFDQIAFDTLGISEIPKNHEELLLDSEDSLQVEESSHDKLIYYDNKNNSSKKSLNTFEDISEEVKNVAFKNKTTSKPDGDPTVLNKTDSYENTTSSTNIVLVNNNTTPRNIAEVTPKIAATNITKSVDYTQYRTLNVSHEELVPFLNFGDKIPKVKPNVTARTTPKPQVDEVKNKTEDEVNENMDVTVVQPNYENKVPKIQVSPKVTVAREFLKNKPSSQTQNHSIPSLPGKKNTGVNIRTFTNHRGFRNRTIFIQNKRSGVRQTINLTPNVTIASLKPPSDITSVKPHISDVTTQLPVDLTKSEIKVNSTQQGKYSVMDVSTTQIPLANTSVKSSENIDADDVDIDINSTNIVIASRGSFQPLETKTVTTTSQPTTQSTTTQSTTQSTTTQYTTQSTTTTHVLTSTTKQTMTTPSTPTTRIVSTNVVTSVSIKSSKGNATDATQNSETMHEIEANVVAQLSNFTSQTFHNRRNDSITRNPATMYPNITVDASTSKPLPLNRTKFILRPTERTEELKTATVTIPPLDEDTNDAPLQTTESRYVDKNQFNPNLGQPDINGELPIATLFSITDYKKVEVKNITRNVKFSGVETIISRKNEEDNIENMNAAYILAALGFLPMSLIVIYVIKNVINRKNKQFEDFEAELHDSDKKSIITPVARLPALVLDSSTKWEFPRSKLRLQTLLGQGNFGQVWKAEADDLKGHIGLTRLVAVKTIKDGAGTKDRDDLLRELAIMQKMGSHPNVVTLLGCCTEKEPYLLIMEYVMYGKLLTFLRDHRTRRNYYNFSDDAATLTARDLTVFAYCVARGMEYLVSKGIIHRDIAARNILVDHNKLCKIADFGMSRDTVTGEVTEPRQPRNALPVRWMAIESLLYSIFTHKTDVWAFGVLLWEIVTLGSSPYANMSGREVMRLVCAGYRLERPNHCRPELYRVMARTWHSDPEQRPSFAELRTELAGMLDNTAAEGSYVDLESFRADSTVYEIDNCTPRGNYFTVKSRYSEFECDI